MLKVWDVRVRDPVESWEGEIGEKFDALFNWEIGI